MAICGASAALAIAAILPAHKDKEQNTLFTVIAVTSLSTIAMILYPIFYAALGFDDHAVGLLLGATIHDVAQVVGAGYAVSEEAGDVATYIKLLRVALLPLVVIALALFFHRTHDPAEGRALHQSFPWFALAFAALMLLHSGGFIPANGVEIMQGLSRWLLLTAIAALGVKTSLQAMSRLGLRHVLVVLGPSLTLLTLAILAEAVFL